MKQRNAQKSLRKSLVSLILVVMGVVVVLLPSQRISKLRRESWRESSRYRGYSPEDEEIREDGRSRRRLDFETYYKSMRLVPQDEFERFMGALTSKLPRSFRLTAQEPVRSIILNQIERRRSLDKPARHFGEFSWKYLEKSDWFPKDLAWSLPVNINSAPQTGGVSCKGKEDLEFGEEGEERRQKEFEEKKEEDEHTRSDLILAQKRGYEGYQRWLLRHSDSGLLTQVVRKAVVVVVVVGVVVVRMQSSIGSSYM